mmetsp:Transcript_136587/g.248984  ORF Transcript_136587/g.248984 Transcript_136587/m.248984 type:complete len:370 (-) Transcript_136587:70-1179(-)
MAEAVPLEESDGLEFVDASSGDEEEVPTPSHAPRLPLPCGAPTPDVITQQALATRAAFQARGTSVLPLSKEIVSCGERMKKKMPPMFAFSRLLRDPQKHAIWCLWSVCDTFDCCQSPGELRAQQEKLRSAFDSQTPSDDIEGEIWSALRAALQCYSIIQKPFHDLAEGMAARPFMRGATTGLVFNSFDELMLHVYRFGGAIGLIALPVLSEDAMTDGDVAMGALSLGMALQLTDMLNCVGHHFRTLGNRTIPKDLLREHGISESELETNLRGDSSSLVGHAEWQALMAKLLAPVRPWLQHAAWAGERLPRKSCIAVRVGVRMCMRVVLHIERRGYNSINTRTQMFTVRTIGDVAGAMRGSGIQAEKMSL